MSNTIWVLLAIMQFKHFISDYLLQGEYMLGKFKERGWVLPLATHCGIHFLFTIILSLIFTQDFLFSLGIALIDFTLHFTMDRVKASPNLLGRFKPITESDFKLHLSIQNVLLLERSLNVITKEIDYKLKTEYDQHMLNWEKKKRSNRLFWISLGFDQMFHHLTDILIVYMIVTKIGNIL